MYCRCPLHRTRQALRSYQDGLEDHGFSPRAAAVITPRVEAHSARFADNGNWGNDQR